MGGRASYCSRGSPEQQDMLVAAGTKAGMADVA